MKIGDLELLLGGDIVLEILGHPLGSAREVEQAMQAVRELPPGSTLRMSVLREGTILDLVAELRD